MKKKSKFLLLFIILFGICFILNSNISFAIDITQEELAVAKENGIVSALCYVYDIASGTLAKAIIAMFLIVVGWMFFIGFIKWFLLFSFMMAVSLTFGGIQLANIVSGNNYSCDNINNAIKSESDTIYNAGDCSMVNNEIYSTGQVWYKCSTSILGVEKCQKVIDNNSTINVGDIVALGSCQSGYFKKDSSVLLKYKCITNGKFELKNKSDYEFGKCYQGCLESDLKSVADSYNFCNNGTDNCKFNIKENGKLTLFGGKNYYTYGTLLDVNCINDNYTEFNINSIVDVNGATVSCDLGGKFTISGSCKKNCTVSLLEPSKNVKAWHKCTDDKCSIKESTDKKSFSINEKIVIVSCNDGYSLKKDIEKPGVFECSDLYGGWVNKQELGNGICHKTCSINRLMSGSEWYYYNTSIGEAGNIVDNGAGFFPNEYIIAGNCKEWYSRENNTNLIRKCNDSKEWEDVNSASLCSKNCSGNLLKELENVDKFTVTDKITNISRDLSIIDIDDSTNIKNSEILTVLSCKFGYYIENDVIYSCLNGNIEINNKKPCLKNCVFNSESDPSGILTNVLELKSTEPTGYIDIIIDGYYNDGSEHTYTIEENGETVTKKIICSVAETHDACKTKVTTKKPIYSTIVNNDSSKQEINYKIDKCKEGYKLNNNISTTITCNSNGEWKKDNSGSLCVEIKN